MYLYCLGMCGYSSMGKIICQCSSACENLVLELQHLNKWWNGKKRSLSQLSFFFTLVTTLCCFLDKVSSCNPWCPGADFVDQDDLKLTKILSLGLLSTRTKWGYPHACIYFPIMIFLVLPAHYHAFPVVNLCIFSKLYSKKREVPNNAKIL